MLDGQRYFAHYPDEDPALERKPLMSAELIKALATIEKEIRHCLAGTGADGSAPECGSDGATGACGDSAGS